MLQLHTLTFYHVRDMSQLLQLPLCLALAPGLAARRRCQHLDAVRGAESEGCGGGGAAELAAGRATLGESVQVSGVPTPTGHATG